MNEMVQSWIERAAVRPGVLACGVRLADRSIRVKTHRADLTESQVTRAIRDVSETVYALQQNQIVAGRLRWAFENGHLHCVIKPGGVLAALLVHEETADPAGIERLLLEFERQVIGSTGLP